MGGLLRYRKCVPQQLGDVIVVTNSPPIGLMRSQLTNHKLGIVLAIRAWSQVIWHRCSHYSTVCMDGDDTYDTIHSYSQEWKSQVGSPHSSKISYTRRSIVPVSSLFSRHKACSATRTENNYFFRRDVSFYPPRLGQDWDGRLQTKDHVHLV